MLYILTLEDEYEGITINFGVFDKEHIKQAIRDAYRSCATYDHIDKCYCLEDGHLYVTPVKANKLHTKIGDLKHVRVI